MTVKSDSSFLCLYAFVKNILCHRYVIKNVYFCGVNIKQQFIVKKSNWILAAILACFCVTASAQKSTEEPKGKAIVQVFSNFHTGFGDTKNDRGFELDRSYVGYQYDLGKGVQIKGVMDIGQSDDVNDYHRIAYIKNAQITWKTGNWTLTGGLISTTQFNMQEKFWGYRYVMKSFQDQYKFGNSADLGISAAYKFNDWLSADAIVVNGEGYKKVQKNDGLQYGLGATLTPAKALTFRVYYGLNEGSEDTQENTQNLATFIGLKFNRFSIGAEYNRIWNAKYVNENDYDGFSVYSTVNLNKGADLYLRFDEFDGSESAFIAGVQWRLGKYVKLSPNFRWNHKDLDGGNNDRYMGYISCYFGF